MWKYLVAALKSLLPHKPAVRYGLLAFLFLAVGAWATKCHAADSAILFEGGVQYIEGPAAALLVSVDYPGPGDARIEAGLFLVGAVERSDRETGRGVMGGQVLLVDGFGKFDLGLGLAYMNGIHEQLGSQLNFHLMVRYRLPRDWYIAARHWSNAGTTAHNSGLDVISVGRRF